MLTIVDKPNWLCKRFARYQALIIGSLIGVALAMVGVFQVSGADEPPADLKPFLMPPAEFAGDFGSYRSPLLFDNGSPVTTPADWARRRTEILNYWHGKLGAWPPLLEKPQVDIEETTRRESVTQHKIRIQTAPQRTVDNAFLLVPDGDGPFPAVVVVYYEAFTPAGLNDKELRDFAWQLARRGFVTLALGGDPNTYYPTPETCEIQPLSFHAYEAANCRVALSLMPQVDPRRIGITGHSYGGKWAMFAACLDPGFACGAWSDGGIVFDEQRGNVNYWEPWYLGFDRTLPMQRAAGIPNDERPRTGPYKDLIAEGRDLHELHALMAPRPFLVSGGSEDFPARWRALNHTVAVNHLLGAKHRVAMTNRPGHSPTQESNEQLYRFFEWALKR